MGLSAESGSAEQVLGSAEQAPASPDARPSPGRRSRQLLSPEIHCRGGGDWGVTKSGAISHAGKSPSACLRAPGRARRAARWAMSCGLKRPAGGAG